MSDSWTFGILISNDFNCSNSEISVEEMVVVLSCDIIYDVFILPVNKKRNS